MNKSIEVVRYLPNHRLFRFQNMENETESHDSIDITSDACDGCANLIGAISFCLHCKADVCGECKERCISKGHNIRQISQVQMKILVCKEHGESFVTFCKPCQKLCCAVCITGKHDRHSFITISDAAKEARSKLKICLQSQDTTVLSKLQTSRKLIDDGIQEYTDAMDCALEKSKARFQSLRQQLERTEDEWIRNLEKTRTDDLAKMDIMKGNLDNQIRYKDQFIDNCQAILAEGDDAMVLAFASDMNDAESIDSSRILLPSPVHFKPSSRNLPSADDLIGKIQHKGRRTTAWRTFYGSLVLGIVLIFISITIGSFEKTFNADMIEFKTLKTIEWQKQLSTSTAGYTIVHTARNEVWIGDRDSKSVNLYDSNLNMITSIYLGYQIKDMVPTSSDDILATNWREQQVFRITRSGNVNHFIDTSPYYPYGIYINDRQQVVVGLFKLNTDSKRMFKLAIYSTDTSMAPQEMASDVNGRPLFDDTIMQVKQNGNGDYVVSHEKGVVCLTRMGEYRWNYTTTGKTRILSLVCDRYNNIIIGEERNRHIIILNSDGKLLKTLHTENSRSGPISLSLDRDENLWVGHWEHIKVIKYLK